MGAAAGGGAGGNTSSAGGMNSTGSSQQTNTSSNLPQVMTPQFDPANYGGGMGFGGMGGMGLGGMGLGGMGGGGPRSAAMSTPFLPSYMTTTDQDMMGGRPRPTAQGFADTMRGIGMGGMPMQEPVAQQQFTDRLGAVPTGQRDTSREAYNRYTAMAMPAPGQSLPSYEEWSAKQNQLPQFTTPSNVMSPQQRGFTQTSAGVAAGGQNQLDANIRQNVQRMMGNYGSMVDLANQTQTSQADIARAFNTDPGNVYTAMNRPDYKTYGRSGQFYQPIYQSSYRGYQQPSRFYSPGYGMPRSNNPFAYAAGGDVYNDDDAPVENQGIAGLLR